MDDLIAFVRARRMARGVDGVIQGLPYTLGLDDVHAAGDTGSVGTLETSHDQLGDTPFSIRVTGRYHPPICWRVISLADYTTVEWRCSDGQEGKAVVRNLAEATWTEPAVIHTTVTPDMVVDVLYAPPS